MTTDDFRAPAGPLREKVARDDVHRIASEAAQRHSPPLRVVGITGLASGSYAEVLFSSPAIRRDLLVGVFRDGGEQAIRATIEATLNGSPQD